jgi:hypothetical protein
VVIPAHDEERVLGRTLSCLLAGADPGRFEVVVAANACTDRTVEVAEAFSGVTVLDLPEPDKPAALAAGDTHLTTFPRIYLDADVELDTASALALADRLHGGDVWAAAPRRVFDLDGASWLVRAYYAVWQELPTVRDAVFGRGVVAVSEAGHAALGGHARVVNDDGRADALLRQHFAVVPEAAVRIRGPRTTGALLRRRARTARGNTELRRMGSASTSTAQTMREVAAVAVARPRLAASAVAYVALTVAARLVGWRQRRTASQSWGRDEGSRA